MLTACCDTAQKHSSSLQAQLQEPDDSAPHTTDHSTNTWGRLTSVNPQHASMLIKAQQHLSKAVRQLRSRVTVRQAVAHVAGHDHTLDLWSVGSLA